MNTFHEGEYQGSGGHFLTGMLWGMAIGAAVALMFAPRRGVDLRNQMVDSVNRAGRRAKDTYDRASETVNDVASRAADIAENLADRAAMLTAKLNRSISAQTPPTAS